MRVIESTELRERTELLLESLEQGDEPYFVTDHGDPKAVLIGVEEWERIQSALATTEERLDKGAVESFHRAIADIEGGRLRPHDEVIRAYREAHAK